MHVSGSNKTHIFKKISKLGVHTHSKWCSRFWAEKVRPLARTFQVPIRKYTTPYYKALQHTSKCKKVLQSTTKYYSILQSNTRILTHYKVLESSTLYCKVLRRTRKYYKVLPRPQQPSSAAFLSRFPHPAIFGRFP